MRKFIHYVVLLFYMKLYQNCTQVLPAKSLSKILWTPKQREFRRVGMNRQPISFSGSLIPICQLACSNTAGQDIP